MSTQPRHWRTAADALALLRRRHGLTRRDLGQYLGLGSGGVSDLAGRLREARLLVERRAPAQRRGRPSSTLHAHPEGPVALVVDLRHGDWRIGVCAVDGEVSVLAAGPHATDDPAEVVTRLRRRVTRAGRELGGRLLAVGVAVPGQVSGTRLLHASMLGWRDLDLARMAAGLDVPLFAGNDATMAAIAEARVHAEVPRVLLHLVVEVGLGGALVVDGRPVPSARNLHGEFGHLPMGDRRQACPCGAHGCWGIPFDAREVARRLAHPQPADPRAYLDHVLTQEDPPVAVRRLRGELAATLGRGAAGLVNALDPDTVTLGGLAGPMRDAAPERFEQAYETGLMGVLRGGPPEVGTARSGPDAVLAGVGLTAFDACLDADRLARWVGRLP